MAVVGVVELASTASARSVLHRGAVPVPLKPMLSGVAWAPANGGAVGVDVRIDDGACSHLSWLPTSAPSPGAGDGPSAVGEVGRHRGGVTDLVRCPPTSSFECQVVLSDGLVLAALGGLEEQLGAGLVVAL